MNMPSKNKTPVQLSVFKNFTYETIATGNLTIKSKYIFEVEEAQTELKYSVDFENACFKRDGNTVIIIEQKDCCYALSFIDKETREEIYSYMEEDESYDIHDIEKLLSFFKSEKSVKKRDNVVNLIVNQGVFERMIMTGNKKFVEMVLNNGNELVYEAAIKFEKEIINMFEEKPIDDSADLLSDINNIKNKLKNNRAIQIKSTDYKSLESNSRDQPLKEKNLENEFNGINNFLIDSENKLLKKDEAESKHTNQIVNLNDKENQSGKQSYEEYENGKINYKEIIEKKDFNIEGQIKNQHTDSSEYRFGDNDDEINQKLTKHDSLKDKNILKNNNQYKTEVEQAKIRKIISSSSNFIDGLDDDNKDYKNLLSLQSLYARVFINILTSDKIVYVQKMINCIKEVFYVNCYKKLNTIKAIEDTTEILKYLLYLKKCNKKINQSMIKVFLSNKDDENYSKILLHASYLFKDGMRLYLEGNDVQKIFTIIKQTNSSMEKEGTIIIQNLIHSIYALFDGSVSLKLRKMFYRHVHKIFLKNFDYSQPSKSKWKEIYHEMHHEFYNLLFFMCKEHSFMFNEFYINSGLHTFIQDNDLKNTERNIFFYKMKHFLEKNEDHTLSKYFRL